MISHVKLLVYQRVYYGALLSFICWGSAGDYHNPQTRTWQMMRTKLGLWWWLKHVKTHIIKKEQLQKWVGSPSSRFDQFGCVTSMVLGHGFGGWSNLNGNFGAEKCIYCAFHHQQSGFKPHMCLYMVWFDGFPYINWGLKHNWIQHQPVRDLYIYIYGIYGFKLVVGRVISFLSLAWNWWVNGDSPPLRWLQLWLITRCEVVWTFNLSKLRFTIH